MKIFSTFQKIICSKVGRGSPHSFFVVVDFFDVSVILYVAISYIISQNNYIVGNHTY